MEQLELFDREKASLLIEKADFTGRKVMIGLSGGINSMAVLCWLSQIDEDKKPSELHLFYAHFDEHSNDTLRFVLDGVRYAAQRFKKVFYTQTHNSVLEYFEKSKMIPHPAHSPCTKYLKIEPMLEYMIRHQIKIDLVGYVRGEMKRADRMHEKDANLKYYKGFPIIDNDNEWCFSIVTDQIGWYPAIYDLRDDEGNRIFEHNNCLPCKNWYPEDFENGKKYFPDKIQRAIDLSRKLQSYWGRNEEEFYIQFGRPDLGMPKQPCEICRFD